MRYYIDGLLNININEIAEYLYKQYGLLGKTYILILEGFMWSLICTYQSFCIMKILGYYVIINDKITKCSLNDIFVIMCIFIIIHISFSIGFNLMQKFY